MNRTRSRGMNQRPFVDGFEPLESRTLFNADVVMEFPRTIAYTHAVDVNLDGHMDIVAVANKTVGIALSDGAGGYGTPRYIGFNAPATHVAIGDLDGDGDGDLAVITGDRLVRVYDDGPSAYFTRRSLFDLGYQATGLVLGQFSGDSVLDAAVIQPPVPGRAVPTVRLIIQSADETLSSGLGRPIPHFGGVLATAQIRSSSTDEIVVTSPTREQVFEVGSVRLKLIGDAPRLDVPASAIADVDDDGLLDSVTFAHGGGAAHVAVALRNVDAPDGFTYQTVLNAVGGRVRVAGLADLTADGRVDVVVIGQIPGLGIPNAEAAYLIMQNPDGSFGEPELLVNLPFFFEGNEIDNIWIAGYSDTNGDGTLDVIVETYAEFAGQSEYAVRAIESPDPMSMLDPWSLRTIYPLPFEPLNGSPARIALAPNLLGSGIDGLIVRNHTTGPSTLLVCGLA